MNAVVRRSLRFEETQRSRILAEFPPEDISSFLELNAGDWLALRSLLSPERALCLKGEVLRDGEGTTGAQGWHDSDRSDLHIAVLEPTSEIDWGGLEIVHSEQSKAKLVFRKDGTVMVGSRLGLWHLEEDGSLELAVEEEDRILKEWIWFRKPNLRLRCTLEQLEGGRPGRASFSSEIRRVSRPEERPLDGDV